jgi:hypothetical protein
MTRCSTASRPGPPVTTETQHRLQPPAATGRRLFAAGRGECAVRRQEPGRVGKMSLGGSNGVRAYPAGEAAGDQGILARLELRKTLGVFGNSIVEGALFADAGRVTVNKKPWDNSENAQPLRLRRGPERLQQGPGVQRQHRLLARRQSASEPKSARRLWLSVSGSPQAFTGLASSSGSRGRGFRASGRRHAAVRLAGHRS